MSRAEHKCKCGKNCNKIFKTALLRALEGPGHTAHEQMIEILRLYTHGPDHGAFVVASLAAWLVAFQGTSEKLIWKAFRAYLPTFEVARLRQSFSTPIAQA